MPYTLYPTIQCYTLPYPTIQYYTLSHPTIPYYTLYPIIATLNSPDTGLRADPNSAHEVVGGKSLPRSIALQPFGGGVSMCPGRPRYRDELRGLIIIPNPGPNLGGTWLYPRFVLSWPRLRCVGIWMRWGLGAGWWGKSLR